MPRGLRRTEPQQPAVGSTIGSTTITQPLQPDRADPGYIANTSNEGMKPGPYHDTADVPKPSKPSGVHEVFTLGK